jgi:lipid A ethanolaminephosphotransferase
LNSLRKLVASSWSAGKAPFQEIGTDAEQQKSGRARTVGVLVVGETARADHFSLNGYERNTNPRLGLRDLLNFPNAKAAGTSTAYSVPYMFSFLGNRFTTERAARESNLLDVLTRAGVKVVWIDNNSGSKRVADRVHLIDLHSQAQSSSPYYGFGGLYDEALVGEMEREISSTEGDLLIVLHTMGSHGPAYYRRYPGQFEVFKPCCKESSPQQSPQQEVVNAYDNTILYTDYVLDRLIAVLEARQKPEDSFLLYVSDHGESLGEKGVYLHGLPDLLAPKAQTHIPMVAWLSPRLVADHSLDYPLLRQRSAAPCSHDNVASTILGLFEVKTSLYSRDLDLFAPRSQ